MFHWRDLDLFADFGSLSCTGPGSVTIQSTQKSSTPMSGMFFSETLNWSKSISGDAATSGEFSFELSACLADPPNNISETLTRKQEIAPGRDLQVSRLETVYRPCGNASDLSRKVQEFQTFLTFFLYGFYGFGYSFFYGFSDQVFFIYFCKKILGKFYG